MASIRNISLFDTVPRHVALYLHGLTEGGAQRRTLSLARGLSDRGIRVDLVVIDASGPLKSLVPASVRLYVLRSWLVSLPWIRSRRKRQVKAATLALARYIRSERPDVVVSAANHTALSTASAHRLAACEQTALVFRVSNALTSRARAKAKSRVRAMQRALQQVDGVATVSAALATEVAALCSVPHPTIRAVANPVIDPYLEHGTGHPSWEPPDHPFILAVGRLVRQKDFETLLRAVALVAPEHRLPLVILGDGPERERLVALACELGIDDGLQMPGRVAHPFPALRKARLFVNSARWDGLPGTVIESLWCGCPVVSTDTPGAREVLLDGLLGQLVPASSPEAMAVAIRSALSHSGDRTQLIERGRDFGVERATSDFLEVLSEASRIRSARRTR